MVTSNLAFCFVASIRNNNYLAFDTNRFTLDVLSNEFEGTGDVVDLKTDALVLVIQTQLADNGAFGCFGAFLVCEIVSGVLVGEERGDVATREVGSLELIDDLVGLMPRGSDAEYGLI